MKRRSFVSALNSAFDLGLASLHRKGQVRQTHAWLTYFASVVSTSRQPPCFGPARFSPSTHSPWSGSVNSAFPSNNAGKSHMPHSSTTCSVGIWLTWLTWPTHCANMWTLLFNNSRNPESGQCGCSVAPLHRASRMLMTLRARYRWMLKRTGQACRRSVHNLTLDAQNRLMTTWNLQRPKLGHQSKTDLPKSFAWSKQLQIKDG